MYNLKNFIKRNFICGGLCLVPSLLIASPFTVDVNAENVFTNIYQQKNKTIKGSVVDDSGVPIIGANIMVRGTTNGTITDMNGNFSLTVEENAVLEVSYIGYVNYELRVGSQDTYSIVLKEDSQSLDEVVVIGYGTTKRKDFTGSVSSVKMENSPVALASNSNALEALKGSVTGLDIGATNSAGGQPSMQIRGQNSISGSNDPLVVVDGVIF